MRTEIKRADGSKYRITIDSYASGLSSLKYVVFVERCAPGKRKFIKLIDTNDYSWRKLSIKERDIYNEAIIREHLTNDEIQTALEAYWGNTRPNQGNTQFSAR